MEPDLLFKLPDELILSPLFKTFPCREAQIRALATLVYPYAAPAKNIVIHGVEATGKSAVTEALLRVLSSSAREDDGAEAPEPVVRYGMVNSIECVTARHLYETTVNAVAEAIGWEGALRRCENTAQLTVALTQMLEYVNRPLGWRFVLVFDAIDRQKEAPHTLLPALARLSEIIKCLTTVFVMTCPEPLCLRETSTPHLHFPNYNKKELVSILAATLTPATVLNTTETETRDLWPRFCGAVHDALARPAARSLPEFIQACQTLWPRFVAPIVAGNYGAKDFSRLLIAGRMHFQDERVLDPGVLAQRDDMNSGVPPADITKAPSAPGTPTKSVNGTPSKLAPTPSRLGFTPSRLGTPSKAGMASQFGTPNKPIATPTAVTPARTVVLPGTKATDLSALPTTARLLLISAYLASHNTARHDTTLFCTSYHGRKRRRGGMIGTGRRAKHRKIARKLLGAHAFVLERMLAIYAAVKTEWAPQLGPGAMDGDLGMGVATLASLRLLVRVGAAGSDPMDRGGKWRVNVGWEVVRGVGRSIGVEVEEWLID